MSQEEKTDNKEQSTEEKPMSPDLEKCIKEQVGQGKSEEEAKSFCDEQLNKLDEEPKDEVPKEAPSEEPPKEPVQELQPEQQPPTPEQQPPEQPPLADPNQPPQDPNQLPQDPTQHMNFEACIQQQLAQGMNNKDAVVNCAVQVLQTMESQGQASPVPNLNGTYNVGGVQLSISNFPGGFEQCVEAMKSKGMDKEGAISKCEGIFNAKINKQANFADYVQVQEAKDKSDKLYVKAFLLDPSVNLNHWGVSEASLDQRITTFVGRPLVLTEDFGHPDLSDMTLSHMLQYQDIYRVGTIIDVVKTAATNNPNGKVWYAVCEITDEKAKEAFRTHKLPLYVSPAVAHLPNETDSSIDEWFGVHLALVDEPAFGVKKAMITGSCSGDTNQCVMHLRQAKIDKFGYGNCGFCVYEKLVSTVKTADAQAEANLQVGENNKPETVELQQDIKIEDTKKVETIDSSLNSENTQEQLTMSQTSEKEIVKDEPKKVEQKVAEKQVITQPLGPVEARLVRFETENNLLKQRLDSVNEENEQLRLENAKLATANRRAEIAGILTADLIADENERTQLIEKFTESNVTPEMVLAMHNTIKGAYKTAKTGYNARTPIVRSAKNNSDADLEGRMLAKDIRKLIIRSDA